jgi:Tol biopolymer transport system component
MAAFAADTGAELFQKAVTQERAAGNLEEAIKLYQRVATEYASDRALAAKALVQEARCYEKLGKDKAVKLYEQVARDYRDQREPVATANARLVVLRQGEHVAAAPATMTQRKIESSGSGASTLTIYQTDGQRRVFKDSATGALMIGDLARRDRHVIFKPKADESFSPISFTMTPSRDLSTVAFFLTRPGGLALTAIRTDGSGYRELKGDDSCKPDWSWDNRYLFFCQTQPDTTVQVLRATVADGETRKVQVAGYDHEQLRVSPNGEFVANSRLGPGKVFVTPGKGGEPQLISDDARVIDWTRDGRFLAIVRAGSLYLAPLKDGRRTGDLVLVRSGNFVWGQTYASGAISLESPNPDGVFQAWLGMLNPDGRVTDWKRLHLSGKSHT